MLKTNNQQKTSFCLIKLLKNNLFTYLSSRFTKSGFTIIELMLVLAILGVLAATIYPTYFYYIINTRRLEAKIALLNLATHMEKYYSEHQNYEGATLPESSANDAHRKNSWYNIVITQQTHDFFSLAAIPIGSQAKYDNLCQTLTFNSLGKKDITATDNKNPSGNAKQCW